MTLMRSGDHLLHFSVPGVEPGGWCQTDCFAGFQPRQGRQDVSEVFAHVDFKAAAILHDGIEDSAFAPGFAVSYESSHPRGVSP